MRWIRCVLFAALAACAHGPASQDRAVETHRLVKQVRERETAAFTERREDVELEGEQRFHERTPYIVARGEAGPLERRRRWARLYGDAEGTQGFSVDNVLLFEVERPDGKTLARVVVGLSDGVWVGKERADHAGPPSFTFGPGEVDLTPHLPDDGPFMLKVTALDGGGVGHVSDVYLRLERNQR